MSIEKVLDNQILTNLRANAVITESEVAIQIGDLYYAKNILTNEKRILNLSGNQIAPQSNESRTTITGKTLLKG